MSNLVDTGIRRASASLSRIRCFCDGRLGFDNYKLLIEIQGDPVGSTTGNIMVYIKNKEDALAEVLKGFKEDLVRSVKGQQEQ